MLTVGSFFAEELIINAGGRSKNLQGLQVIGTGRERFCLYDPADPDILYKLSLRGNRQEQRQNKREIGYFKFLQRHRVPFTHLPKFYGSFTAGKYLGIIQEYIGSTAEYTVHSLDDVLHGRAECTFTPEALQNAFNELVDYLLTYGIVLNNMHAHNVLIRQSRRDGSIRLYLIDSFGTHAFIPLKNYIRPLAAKRTARECRRLVAKVNAAEDGRIKLQLPPQIGRQ